MSGKVLGLSQSCVLGDRELQKTPLLITTGFLLYK
jgi:hypothetical protein